MGVRALSGRVSDASPLNDPLFVFRGEGFDAEMRLGSSGDFVVLQGSKARLRTTGSIPKGVATLRDTLLEKGILQQEGGFLTFTTDYSFSSPSFAAAAVVGASANGRILWKISDGRCYAAWEAGQEMSRAHMGAVSPGAIYTALDRLEQRGLVTSRLGDPTPQRGGKRKRYYRIEPQGAELLRRSHAALARMAHGLEPKLERS